MLLVRCTYCSDTFSLRSTPRICSCMASGGVSQGDMTKVWGDASPFYLDDAGLEGSSDIFGYWVPKDSPRILRSEKPLGGQPIPF